MSELENTESFKKAEKRILELKRKLEDRIDRTDLAMEEVKKINREIIKLQKSKQARRKPL